VSVPLSGQRKPCFRQFINLWTLDGYAFGAVEGTIDEKLRLISEAGFDAIMCLVDEDLRNRANDYGLELIGEVYPGDFSAMRKQVLAQTRQTVKRFNAHVGDAWQSPRDGADLISKLLPICENEGVELSIETHRGTVTESPEKTWEIADRVEQTTGSKLRLTFDFSHWAVVKHLDWSSLAHCAFARKDLLGVATQFHFRPFNGHHIQISRLTRNGDYGNFLSFFQAVVSQLTALSNEKEIWVCPEIGPLNSGYGLPEFGDTWSQVLGLQQDFLDRGIARR
jgi:hypothetical protein